MVYAGDAFDSLLDRKRFPEFHGVRKKLVYEWPTDQKSWDTYTQLRKQAFREDREPTEANKFYADNRERMDAGRKVAWPERKNDNELTAIQHAVNLKIEFQESFDAEFQNTPQPKDVDVFAFLKLDEIPEKLTGRPKNRVAGHN